MEKAELHILKGKDVKLEGQFRIDVEQSPAKTTSQRVITTVEPMVSVVEKDSEFAVVEFICTCGAKTYIKCKYESSQSDNVQSENEPSDVEQVSDMDSKQT